MSVLCRQAIYDVPLLPAEDGLCSGGGSHGVPGPQRQSLWLTEAEWKSLLPENPRTGATTEVPAKLVKRICLFGLRSATAWHLEHFWDPDSVRQGEIKLTTLEATASRVRMRVHGSVLLVKKSGIKTRSDAKIETPPDLEDRYDARLEGQLVYDPQQKKSHAEKWSCSAITRERIGRTSAARRAVTSRRIPSPSAFPSNW